MYAYKVRLAIVLTLHEHIFSKREWCLFLCLVFFLFRGKDSCVIHLLTLCGEQLLKVWLAIVLTLHGRVLAKR